MHAKVEERFCSLSVHFGCVVCKCQKLEGFTKASKTSRLLLGSVLADGKLQRPN